MCLLGCRVLSSRWDWSFFKSPLICTHHPKWKQNRKPSDEGAHEQWHWYMLINDNCFCDCSKSSQTVWSRERLLTLWALTNRLWMMLPIGPWAPPFTSTSGFSSRALTNLEKKQKTKTYKLTRTGILSHRGCWWNWTISHSAVCFCS